jgi:hypothetical protein
MKPKTYFYKNISILFLPTYDEPSGLKLFEILPAWSIYKDDKNYGMCLRWLVLEVIINYGTR